MIREQKVHEMLVMPYLTLIKR